MWRAKKGNDDDDLEILNNVNHCHDDEMEQSSGSENVDLTAKDNENDDI